jgi:hypothetical protein
MNNIFNLPQNATDIGGIISMFTGCSGDLFAMNTVFTTPPSAVSASRTYASRMFEGCNGSGFTSGAIQFFGDVVLSQATVLNGSSTASFSRTFNGCTNMNEVISPATIPQLSVPLYQDINTFQGCTSCDLSNCPDEWA